MPERLRGRSWDALQQLGDEPQQAEQDELGIHLARVPDLTRALRDATPEIQRQVFQAFELEILYDKAEHRVEVSATVSEAVADAFENTKTLQKEGLEVLPTDIAGAGFEHLSPTVAYRFVEVVELRP